MEKNDKLDTVHFNVSLQFKFPILDRTIRLEGIRNIAFSDEGIVIEGLDGEKIIVPVPFNISTVSDGYHSFGELYEHRHMLFIALLLYNKDIAWRSLYHDDGSCYEGWFVAGLDLPTGQITYHLPLRLWSMLDSIKTLKKAPKYDGHTSKDVINRLEEWIKKYLKEKS